MAESTPGSGDQDRATPKSSTEAFAHAPVMLDEVVELTEALPPGPFLDATLGGGGHAEAVLNANSGLSLIGIDQDQSAIDAASLRLKPFGSRLSIHKARFSEVSGVLSSSPTEPTNLSGFLFDLGVSSPQLDGPERGFSFRNDGPLDMRMDTDRPFTAADIVNTYERTALISLLRRNADERFASRIADAIIAARPLASTAALAAVVVAAIPAAARRSGGHPAKRTFQAIRIEVNDELDVLGPALSTALDALAAGGRGLVLTYHSGEDRIVKGEIRKRTTVDRPAGLPVGGPEPTHSIVRPAVRRASENEIESNPRARSARLRSVERLAA